MTPGRSLEPCVLALEQESNVSNIGDKKCFPN